MLDLNNRTAIVCGASSGIGAATAVMMAKAGAKLVLVARREEALKRVAEDCRNGQCHATISCDFSIPEDVSRLTGVISSLEKLDILVNNTGGPSPNKPSNTTIEEVQAALQAHLFAAMSISQAAVAVMKKSGYGRIINIVSVTARVPLVHLTASNIVRGAVLAWAKTLSEELAPEGMTVNNVLPGYTRTDRVTALLKDSASKNGITEAQAETNIIAGIPFQRLATAEEIASAAVYLASPLASYVTGTSIAVDGGFIRTV